MHAPPQHDADSKGTRLKSARRAFGVRAVKRESSRTGCPSAQAGQGAAGLSLLGSSSS